MTPAHGPARAWQSADWPAPGNVAALTTWRHGAGGSVPPFDHFNLGARSGDEAAAVAANRRELVARLALPSAPHWLQQVHGSDVVRLDVPAGESDPEHEPQADAAVTDRPGVVLAILSADCLPVVLAAEDGSVIAAAHAGWRGLAAGVLEATVAAMAIEPARLLAWLGPAAGPQAYEVGSEVHQAFTDGDAQAATAFVATRPGHWRVDLYALARQRLARAGVQRVSGGGACTISEPGRYFSHRRDQRTGRMATLAWRRS